MNMRHYQNRSLKHGKIRRRSRCIAVGPGKVFKATEDEAERLAVMRLKVVPVGPQAVSYFSVSPGGAVYDHPDAPPGAYDASVTDAEPTDTEDDE